jgi:hypothetical protein
VLTVEWAGRQALTGAQGAGAEGKTQPVSHPLTAAVTGPHPQPAANPYTTPQADPTSNASIRTISQVTPTLAHRMTLFVRNINMYLPDKRE